MTTGQTEATTIALFGRKGQRRKTDLCAMCGAFRDDLPALSGHEVKQLVDQE